MTFIEYIKAQEEKDADISTPYSKDPANAFIQDAKEALRQQEWWKDKVYFTPFPEAKDFTDIKKYLNDFHTPFGRYSADDLAIAGAEIVWNNYIQQNGASE